VSLNVLLGELFAAPSTEGLVEELCSLALVGIGGVDFIGSSLTPAYDINYSRSPPFCTPPLYIYGSLLDEILLVILFWLYLLFMSSFIPLAWLAAVFKKVT
jgi:hypothetical protein